MNGEKYTFWQYVFPWDSDTFLHWLFVYNNNAEYNHILIRILGLQYTIAHHLSDTEIAEAINDGRAEEFFKAILNHDEFTLDDL